MTAIFIASMILIPLIYLGINGPIYPSDVDQVILELGPWAFAFDILALLIIVFSVRKWKSQTK